MKMRDEAKRDHETKSATVPVTDGPCGVIPSDARAPVPTGAMSCAQDRAVGRSTAGSGPLANAGDGVRGWPVIDRKRRPLQGQGSRSQGTCRRTGSEAREKRGRPAVCGRRCRPRPRKAQASASLCAEAQLVPRAKAFAHAVFIPNAPSLCRRGRHLSPSPTGGGAEA